MYILIFLYILLIIVRLSEMGVVFLIYLIFVPKNI